MTYYTHTIDPATCYCTHCGKHLVWLLQRNRRWVGNTVTPTCNTALVGISHLVRGGR